MVCGAIVAASQLRRPYPPPSASDTAPAGSWCSATRVPAGSCCSAAKSLPQPWCNAAKPAGYYGNGGSRGRINGYRGHRTQRVLGNPGGDGYRTQRLPGNPGEALQWAWQCECDIGLPRNLAFDGRFFEKYFFSRISKPYPSWLVHLSHPQRTRTLWVALMRFQAPTPLPLSRSSILSGFGNFGTTHIEPVEYDDSVY